MSNTRDISKFGQSERHEAAKLLLAIGTLQDKTILLGDDVAVEFNPNSGNVFLIDGDYNTAMLRGEILDDFISCPECGAEDFASEFKTEHTDECCQEYATASGV